MEPITFATKDVGNAFLESTRQLLSSKLDVQLEVNGKFLFGNKILLSGFSEPFKLLILSSFAKIPTIKVSNQNVEDVKSVLEYVMEGKVEVSPDQLEKFKAALKNS